MKQVVLCRPILVTMTWSQTLLGAPSCSTVSEVHMCKSHHEGVVAYVAKAADVCGVDTVRGSIPTQADPTYRIR